MSIIVPRPPAAGRSYVRHRDRMVQQSVFEDLTNTLIACRWLAGTTSQPVIDPYNQGDGYRPVVTAPADTLPLLEGNPVVLIDYFPEAEGGSVAGEPSTGQTALNTLALDNGTRIDSAPMELGNPSGEFVTYRFNMAFYASSDAVAQALLNDLADRYRGRVVRPDVIDLWDYNSEATTPVVAMSVESFQYTSNTDQSIAPNEVHLYFAELVIEDAVD